MTENIRAYIIVTAFSGIALFLLNQWNPVPEHKTQIRRWAAYWIVMTSVAFLAYDYWFFALSAGIILLFSAPKNIASRLAIYFFLLPALPILEKEIPGFGGVRFFFIMSYPRLLVLFVLVPILFSTTSGNSTDKTKNFYPSDKYIYIYIVLSIILAFRDNNLTQAFRTGFHILLDIFFPYFIISRNVRTVDSFRSVFHAIMNSAFVLSLMGVFESAKEWKLYRPLQEALDMPRWSRFNYVNRREGFLRIGTTMATIPFGYFLVIGIAATNYFRSYFSNFRIIIIAGIIVLALLATLSRGPWVGAAIFVIVFAFYNKNRMKTLSLLAVAVVVSIPLLTVLPGGEKFLSMLPFVGEGGHAETTISYRQQLLENGIEVIKKNPWFGSALFKDNSEMEEMRQGEGIIDVVNTYLQIGLKQGLVGLTLFVWIFASLLLSVRKALLASRSLGDEYYRIGQTLLATTVAILVIIATVSNIDFIPVYYWAMAGLCAAYSAMINRKIFDQRPQQGASIPPDL